MIDTGEFFFGKEGLFFAEAEDAVVELAVFEVVEEGFVIEFVEEDDAARLEPVGGLVFEEVEADDHVVGDFFSAFFGVCTGEETHDGVEAGLVGFFADAFGNFFFGLEHANETGLFVGFVDLHFVGAEDDAFE